MVDRLLEPDVEKFIRCDICGGEIYEGANYWIIDGDAHCESCKDDFLRQRQETYEPSQD